MGKPMMGLFVVLVFCGAASYLKYGPDQAPVVAAVQAKPGAPPVQAKPGTPPVQPGNYPTDLVGRAALAAQVGYHAGPRWRSSTLVEAVAFAGIESAWRPGAVSSTGCIGLWQLCPTRMIDVDPQINADRAYGKWSGCRGGSFDCDWTPYDQGHASPAWATDYGIAQRVVAALPGGGA